MAGADLAALPTSIRIAGRDWTIRPVPGLRESGGACGLCDYDTHVISIDTDMEPIDQRDTLLHEVIHAVESLAYLGMSERQVSGLATGLTAAFADNPDFIKFISPHVKRKRNPRAV